MELASGSTGSLHGDITLQVYEYIALRRYAVAKLLIILLYLKIRPWATIVMVISFVNT